MARIKMRDTTATADTGSLRAGEVYEVPADVAERLVDIGLASKTTAQTTADRNAELANEGEGVAPEFPPGAPEQTTQERTAPEQTATPQRQPLNQPQAQQRGSR
jgi:hypothetical protein